MDICARAFAMTVYDFAQPHYDPREMETEVSGFYRALQKGVGRKFSQNRKNIQRG